MNQTSPRSNDIPVVVQDAPHSGIQSRSNDTLVVANRAPHSGTQPRSNDTLVVAPIQQLIQQLCPQGVEWKKLGEVCEIKGRIGFRGYTRADLVEESEGAITLSPSNIRNQVLTFEDCSYISWFKYEESPEIKVSVGDIVFTKTASVSKTALVKCLPKEATINPQLVLLKDIKCDSAYLAYYLKTDTFQMAVKKLTGVGSVPNVPQSALIRFVRVKEYEYICIVK